MEIVLSIICVLLILSVFLSLVKNEFWVFKLFEYPRLQKLILMLVAAGGWIFFWPLRTTFYQVVASALVISIIYLAYKIWPYTVFSRKEMKRLRSTDTSTELKIFSANVLQENTQYSKLLQQIRKCDPDIIFLLETNSAWDEAMRALEKDYPYSLLAPRENTYGLLFYSRLKVDKSELMFLVKDDIPSINIVIVLPSGQKVQLWGLHPEPPVPGEALYSTAKDKELMKVALKVKDSSLPCIVFGDLNDVAWSHTTELFRKTSGLLDPRRGRGFYSTFSAHSWFIRFPLDYIFCSQQFFLVNMARLPPNGSDHFATFTHLTFRKDISHMQKTQKPDHKELEEAHEKAAQPVPAPKS